MTEATERAAELIDGMASRAIRCALVPGVVLAQEQCRTHGNVMVQGESRAAGTLYTIEALGDRLRYWINQGKQGNPPGLVSRAQMVKMLADEIAAGLAVRAGKF